MEVASLQSLSVQPEPFSPTPEQHPPSGQQTSSAVISEPDVVTIQPMTEDKSQMILNQQIRLALSETFAVNVASTPGGYPENLSPAPLAGQILDTVRGLLSVSVNAPQAETKQDSPIDMARESVDQGVQQTQNVLSNLGALQGRIGEAVDQTQTLIHQGLDTMEQNPPVVSAESTAASGTAYLASIDRTETTALEIETTDGDKVTVTINSQQSGFSGMLISGEESHGGYVSVNGFSSSKDMTLTVEGNLDKKELHAIARMIKKVAKIAERFFDGNILGAMKKAASLHFDSKQISGFSLDLSFEETRQVAAVSQTARTVPTQSGQSTGETPGVPVSMDPPAVPSITPEPVSGTDTPASTDASAAPGTEPPSIPDVEEGSGNGGAQSPSAPVGMSILLAQFQQMVLEIQSSGLFKEPKQAINDMVEAVARHRHPQGHEDHYQANRVGHLLKALTNTLFRS